MMIYGSGRQRQPRNRNVLVITLVLDTAVEHMPARKWPGAGGYLEEVFCSGSPVEASIRCGQVTLVGVSAVRIGGGIHTIPFGSGDRIPLDQDVGIVGRDRADWRRQGKRRDCHVDVIDVPVVDFV